MGPITHAGGLARLSNLFVPVVRGTRWLQDQLALDCLVLSLLGAIRLGCVEAQSLDPIQPHKLESVNLNRATIMAS